MEIRVAFPTDEHFPYQDDSARQVALKIVEDFNPTDIMTGSDGLDFYQISHYSHDPLRVKATNLQHEIDAWRAGQREWIAAAPNAYRHYLIGNHEDRLYRYLADRAPELAELEIMKLGSLLKFDSLRIPDDEKMEVVFGEGRLVVKHGQFVRKGSAMTARAELEAEKHAISVMSGHTHRGGSIYTKTRRGVVQAHECFCLCDLNPPYAKGRTFDWQHGLSLATVTDDGVWVENIPFYSAFGKTRAIWRGIEYVE